MFVSLPLQNKLNGLTGKGMRWWDSFEAFFAAYTNFKFLQNVVLNSMCDLASVMLCCLTIAFKEQMFTFVFNHLHYITK